MDHVSKIINSWSEVKPDLDVESMEVIGRMKLITQYFMKEMEKNFANVGLNAANFDVLATLLRSSKQSLSPGELMDRTMVTSGTMTNRVDRLIKLEYVERTTNPNDSRSVIVRLTNKGYNLINSFIYDHVKLQNQLTSTLNKKDKDSLNSILKKISIP